MSKLQNQGRKESEMKKDETLKKDEKMKEEGAARSGIRHYGSLLRRTIIFLWATAPLAACGQDDGWRMVDQMIDHDFPTVIQISTDSLATLMADSAEIHPLLLDVRGAEEYDVSTIEGAIRIDPDATTFPELDSIDRHRRIITFCSVGYRSSRLAERLADSGFTNVQNLKGSIFQWANEGRPVVHDGRTVHAVHPYDRIWGRLLDETLWGGM